MTSLRDIPPDVGLSVSSAGDLHVFGDCPDEPRQLAGDCGRNDGRGFSRPGELTIAPAQPFLRLPCGVSDRLGQAFLPQQLLSADARREPITPGSLDQHAPRDAIPGLRNAALATCGPAGVLGRNQAEIRHELARIAKAGDIAKFGDQCRRRDAIPRSACNARTIGASDQSASAASIWASKRSRRAVAASTAAMQSSSTM